MANSPINWNKAALNKVGDYATGGAIMGALPGFTNPGVMAAAVGLGAALGAGAGIVSTARAKREQNRNLGRQFNK